MTVFLIVLHVLVCVFLILFVLLQPGARGGVGAAFGGAGGQTVFGGRGANTFLAKLTAAAAVVFMLTSISLSYFVSHTSSVMDKRAGATDDAAATAPADATKPAEGAAATPTPSEAPPAEAPATDGSKPAGDAPPAP